MRRALTLIHRWAGLTVALFLIVAGLTGAITSWDHELDEWLNEDLYKTESRGEFRDPLELAAAIEAADPRARVTYVALNFEEGHNAGYFVEPRIDPATGAPYALGYNAVFVDPVTANIAGRRDTTAVSLTRENLMPFLRTVHYSLHIPSMWGTDRIGYWIMGTVALIWLIDSFVGFYLTTPRKLRLPSIPHRRDPATWWQRWKPAWMVRWRAGGYKLNFDLHRAGGLWVWGIIIVVAFTSFSLNLYREVFYPVLSLVSKTTPGPYETRTMAPLGTFIEPKLSFAQVVPIAAFAAKERGFATPPGGVYYEGRYGFYNVSFFNPGGDHDQGGMGLSNLYLDANTGAVLSENQPWKGTVADVFVQLQFPLHSGRILGMPGRIMMSLMGLLVAMLSVTGIVIWAKKRRARLLQERREKAISTGRPQTARPRTA
ncbi:PepSY-associated TM helix domain-containing protein [Pigmentiphaga litoralis]|uniref:Putative iron-regulated membrane protein n=1 Tax=Pigmentiphaga litoralis TaxID=516702 RepID=A0A7Y9LPM7_9BURK|nr:PepSY-associated TM helix domain-containing protein [Pigmentiphaga litoralis]NYE21697.1 putative iron-regulated membrane protein [Pigmentiphaga litoralis]NYE84688.1 putative iron-regulated membrane protein [Pigmentiphaga litoralis]